MAVKHGLLALLRDDPHYGYQLKTEFESVTGGVWPLNVGQVYTTLDRLERDGLVTMELGDDDQKLYSITRAGVDELGDWWQAVPADEPPPRDELMLKVLMAIEHGPDHALDVLTRQRSALTALLQMRRRERSAVHPPGAISNGEGLAALLVTDALIVRAEADLRWLEVCEARISTLKANS
ncbi:PadR family transcriptional regulator [Ilumatobacter coccineus]|jgi:DNA-binding PadR family transcriptional regulator|uniref:Putative PadR family transcriptional regulator n=1 Tax=Ilumatobacter coccineus (strain NBRC 103263 / KCTC 29153 / YM16-304) TaxID=1313172 RepID=A0A6C7EB81_ILUCY|nr:PadR family transcriptional regulator [Ilumatobacter coccineus]BAN01266.1 putative PadR family transcriptional regulator [Ilumatobacter coccineus YM16-304]